MGYINNIQVDSTTHLIEPTLYAASSTSNSGAAYTASISDFSLVTGVTIQIKFSVTNKANATLSINNGDVKNIYYNNANVTANLFKANHIYELTYDGTQWQVVGDVSPVQYFTWTITSGYSGVSISDSDIFTTDTYCLSLVVVDGISNLNAPLIWTSGNGTFSIQSKQDNTAVPTSGTVSGYAIIARGTDITSFLSSTNIT